MRVTCTHGSSSSRVKKVSVAHVSHLSILPSLCHVSPVSAVLVHPLRHPFQSTILPYFPVLKTQGVRHSALASRSLETWPSQMQTQYWSTRLRGSGTWKARVERGCSVLCWCLLLCLQQGSNVDCRILPDLRKFNANVALSGGTTLFLVFRDAPLTTSFRMLLRQREKAPDLESSLSFFFLRDGPRKARMVTQALWCPQFVRVFTQRSHDVNPVHCQPSTCCRTKKRVWDLERER